MKDKTTAAIFSLFLGGIGIHKFYLGKVGQGIIYLLFCWTFIPAFIGFIEFIILISMADYNFNLKYNTKSKIQTTYQQEKKYCITCGTELTFMSSPNLNAGFLKDGERVCRKCFAKIAKIDKGFELNSKKKYDTHSIKQLLKIEPADEISTNNIFTTSVKSTGNNTEMTIGLDEETLMSYVIQQQEKRDAEIKAYNYQPAIIQRQGLQMLESINIISNTKNIDTSKGRFEFIKKMYDEFIKASFNRRYITDIQRSIDEYKRMYYDRVINDFELQLVIKPNFDNLHNFYSQCIFNTFIKYSEEQKQQIGKLKRENAKNNRREKIIEIGNEAIFELDKIEIESKHHFERISKIKQLIEKLNTKKQAISPIDKITIEDFKNGVVINPKTNFELTLYNTSKTIIHQITKILKDDSIWNKANALLPIFAEHNTKCKEIEEYIQKYKPVYKSKIEELKQNSDEYQNTSEMNKFDIVNEFKELAIKSIYEHANCDLHVLFSGNDIDITIDDELIKDFGFKTISKYFGFKMDKVYIDWERKEFDDLIKAGLANDITNIPTEEILKTQTLKILNKICEKEDGHFKRKNKAINYLNENPNFKNNIGKYIATRKIFKIKPLPEKYNNIDFEMIENQWNYLREYISVLSNTYQASEQYTADIKEDNSWIKEFRVDKFEDLNSNFMCLQAREKCKKKYSKSNPPKLPFHVGCNCDLRKEI